MTNVKPFRHQEHGLVTRTRQMERNGHLVPRGFLSPSINLCNNGTNMGALSDMATSCLKAK